MKVSDYVRNKIDKFPKGYVFTYADFSTKVDKKEAIIKALNRLSASGKIAKMAKGKYYKPEESPFGTLMPEQKQIVKDLLEKDGRNIIGYLTGYSIYNKLGLSTQVSNVIQIGRRNIRPALKRDRFKIVFIKQKNNITRENIPLLQILDAIRYIKKIPDAKPIDSFKRLKAILKEQSTENILSMIKLSMNYPPSTRALLGAMIGQCKPNINTTPLHKSLNPITKYKIGIGKELSLEDQKWNIL